MFNSSLRRAARSCPNAAISTRPGLPTGHGSIAATFTTQRHQRRHSSSKPPVPPNSGSPAIPASSVKQVGAPRTEKRSGTDSRLSKRKVAKSEKPDAVKQEEDYSNEWTKSLPSVPSTQYMNPKDVYVASFFSTHRPISITGPLPPETQVEDIDKIFKVRPKFGKSRRTQDVIYTLNSAVQNLDEHIANQQPSSQHEDGVAYRADIIKALTQHNHNVTNPAEGNPVQHLDSQPQTSVRVPGNVKMVIQEIARRFRPFNVPPVPEPVPEIDLGAPHLEDAASAEANESLQARQLELQIENQDNESQIHHVVRNGQEPHNPNSRQFFTSHRSPAVENPTEAHEIAEPASEQDARRGGRTKRGVYVDPSRGGKMYAISVKRQRRLKMKKHKYKKLMRKTRNLRRRQDKI